MNKTSVKGEKVPNCTAQAWGQKASKPHCRLHVPPCLCWGRGLTQGRASSLGQTCAMPPAPQGGGWEVWGAEQGPHWGPGPRVLTLLVLDEQSLSWLDTRVVVLYA